MCVAGRWEAARNDPGLVLADRWAIAPTEISPPNGSSTISFMPRFCARSLISAAFVIPPTLAGLMFMASHAPRATALARSDAVHMDSSAMNGRSERGAQLSHLAEGLDRLLHVDVVGPEASG